MKSTHTADGSQGVTGSTKRHITSKLQKAIRYATHLLNLLHERDSSGTLSQSLLEVRAYQQSLRGAVAFEKGDWERCLRSFSETRLLYTAFAQSVGTKQDDIFRDLLSSNVDPSMRYAAYQLKLPRTMSIDTIVARYVRRADNAYVSEVLKSNPDLLQGPGVSATNSGTGKPQDVPKTIQWRSRTVDLEDASTAQALASLSAAEAKLASFLSANAELDLKSKAAAYDGVLLPSQDAVDATKTAVDELTAEGVAQGDPRMQSLQITRTAVNYNVVSWRIGRNRVLCGEHDGATFENEMIRKPKKQRASAESKSAQEESNGRQLTRLKERVVLYDSTIQSLESVKDFPGVAADQVFVAELEAKKAYFSSLRCVIQNIRTIAGADHGRCLAIARSHTLRGSKRNALALLARALEVSSQSSLSTLSSDQSTMNGATKLEVGPKQTRFLKDLLERLVIQYRALVELEEMESAASKAKSTNPLPLIERLDEYPSKVVDLTNLVRYPPKIQPVPVKPIFLDVAWNYIDYPGRPRKGATTGADGKAEQEATKSEPKREAKKGWFGFGRS
ncbi:MAG: hypothetical protein LQ352_005320 [Teloschistes flavicans]|nr:MAG: hypothetical protein LQ352_005320 [Teloschistes flavicans]